MFQALIKDLLRDMLNKCLFAYLDDILIFRTRSAGPAGAEQAAGGF